DLAAKRGRLTRTAEDAARGRRGRVRRARPRRPALLHPLLMPARTAVAAGDAQRVTAIRFDDERDRAAGAGVQVADANRLARNVEYVRRRPPLCDLAAAVKRERDRPLLDPDRDVVVGDRDPRPQALRETPRAVVVVVGELGAGTEPDPGG